MHTLRSIIPYLEQIHGLHAIKVLQPEDHTHLQHNEEPHNDGVKACLQKQIILLALHDHTFRKPHVPEVLMHTDGSITFPSVPFPELHIHQAITGSPSSAIHHHLVKKYYQGKDYGYATLLIAFNLLPTKAY